MDSPIRSRGLMDSPHDGVRPVLGLDEDLRNVDADDADAEDQQSAEEPHREHHGDPSLDVAAEDQFVNDERDADQRRTVRKWRSPDRRSRRAALSLNEVMLSISVSQRRQKL